MTDSLNYGSTLQNKRYLEAPSDHVQMKGFVAKHSTLSALSKHLSCTVSCSFCNSTIANMQALSEALLPQSCAAQQGQALFKRLKQLWSAENQPLMHAQVLLLQARLSGLLGPQNTATRLVQQALTLLADQQVPPTPPPPSPPRAHPW